METLPGQDWILNKPTHTHTHSQGLPMYIYMRHKTLSKGKKEKTKLNKNRKIQTCCFGKPREKETKFNIKENWIYKFDFSKDFRLITYFWG